MCHLAKPTFMIAFAEKSAMDVEFYFYPLQELLIEKIMVHRGSVTLPARL